ncbi:MAG: hypothetical protein ACPGEG_01405 [Salibacteraceae bacterium]
MKKVFSILTIALITIGLNAQKITLKDGDPKSLKSVKKWSVTFDYEGMVFDKKGSESEWLVTTQKEKNEKEAGSGDAFVDDWNDAKEELYPMSFATGFTKALQKKFGVSAKPGTSGATITVKTTWAFTGYRMPAGSIKPAKITSTVTFKNENGEVLAVFELDKAQGVPPGASAYNGVGYKTSERMSASYNTSGLALGKYMKKMTFK